MMPHTDSTNEDAWAYLRRITGPALAVAPRDYLANIRANLEADGVSAAVARRDTPALFGFLLGVAQFQGISDRNAAAFARRHGLVTWRDIAEALDARPSCRRLRAYWSFEGCGYRKSAGTCAEPSHIARCPLPQHPARKGSLIQAAYALFFFIRDVSGGDLIGWIDHRLAEADPGVGSPHRAAIMGSALLEPLTNIHGIGEKVWSLALADLLLAADPARERWVTTGAGMVVVDTLLHNHLHRTGILRRFSAGHRYGPDCYAPDGCASIISGLAERIDAREFNPEFPACFPRWVQLAVWRFCSTLELNICNGNLIEDCDRCRNARCPVYSECERLVVRAAQTTPSARL